MNVTAGVEYAGFWRRTAAALVDSLLLLGLVVGPRPRHCSWADTNVDRAKLAVHKYAYEAYPAWAAQHQDHTCPVLVHQLAPYLAPTEVRDPWGSTYQLSCTAKGLVVWSLGEDGQANTADDIWSNEEQHR